MSVVKRYTSTYWASSNPILALDVQGIETDTQKVKYGDGVTAWNDLNYSGFLLVSRHLEVENPVGETNDILIDCGTIIAPNENILIDCGAI